MVRLKEYCHIHSYNDYDYFNSKMVRLKDICAAVSIAVAANFNSKMVRLKAKKYGDIQITDLSFQFQNGAIKRFFIHISFKVLTLFQFQNGAIKRLFFRRFR